MDQLTHSHMHTTTHIEARVRREKKKKERVRVSRHPDWQQHKYNIGKSHLQNPEWRRTNIDCEIALAWNWQPNSWHVKTICNVIHFSMCDSVFALQLKHSLSHPLALSFSHADRTRWTNKTTQINVSAVIFLLYIDLVRFSPFFFFFLFSLLCPSYSRRWRFLVISFTSPHFKYAKCVTVSIRKPFCLFIRFDVCVLFLLSSISLGDSGPASSFTIFVLYYIYFVLAVSLAYSMFNISLNPLFAFYVSHNS